MLYSFLKYENSKFLKSYAFIAPVFIYILCLVGIYIYKNITVLSSFGS
ncbi:ABC transporter permease, partial [Staphylococcus succinus subsp. succinus]